MAKIPMKDNIINIIMCHQEENGGEEEKGMVSGYLLEVGSTELANRLDMSIMPNTGGICGKPEF